MIGLGLSIVAVAVRQLLGGTFSPLDLFASGEQGAWYDPSDMSTLYQDSAGTTPVTAVEQPVGLMLDKSGRGNHAYQTTSTKRPVLSARVNLLTKTEQFDDAVWTKDNVTVSANTADTTDPLGGSTADKIIETATTATHRIFALQTTTVSSSYTFSIYAKYFNRRYLALRIQKIGGYGLYSIGVFDLLNGVKGSSGGTNSSLTSYTVSALSNGWYRLSVTATIESNGTAASVLAYLSDTDSAVDAGTSYAGSTAAGVYLWGASLVPADQASLPYQRVNTATDYDTTGFPTYLKFDSIDDAMQTNSIDFTATDKMTVFAGVRKLSDAATTMIAELSSSADDNPAGTFNFGGKAVGVTLAFFASKGTSIAYAQTSNTAYSAPITYVQTGIGNISGDQAVLRVNGMQAAISTADQGTGNYGNYPLHIGARAGTSLWFNGHFYGLIVRGAQSTAAQISAAETWVNGKAKAF